MKRACAHAAFEMIKDGMTIGLGGGSTVAFLIEELEQSGKRITAVTPSGDTKELCLTHHIPIQNLEDTAHVDLAFDGCDELDYNLNALKSCGGIHVREKIMASMADQYILLADEEKYKETLQFHYPVTIEVIKAARTVVKKNLMHLGAEVKERHSDQKAGLLISDDGNYLMEAYFTNVKDSKSLSDTLDQMAGIAGHSLFCAIAKKAIVAKKEKIDIIER
ncbi:MAG: ribose 5-phosphate isomerase A [Lachnospiraceae bacterium]|nr:ribose 5-phosphate isomerase A [Lachnospiraceae bacterium]